MHRLNSFTRDLKIQHLVGTYFTLLDKSLTAYDNKELPLGIMPMLTLGDARLGNIHAELTAFLGAEKLCKAASRVNVHLERKGHLFLGQI